MKGTAQYHHKVAISAAQLISVADANGQPIDCLGFAEALLQLFVTPLGGTDPVLDVKWQEGDTATGSFADITGAAHKQVLLDDNLVVVSVNLTNTTLTVAAQPANPARLRFVIVDTTPSITAGTIYVTGTRPPVAGEVGNQACSDLINCAAGAGTYYTTNIYASVTAIKTGVVAGVTGTVDFTVLGGAGNETIIAGVDNSGPYVPHIGRINLIGRKRFIRAVPVRGGSSPTGGYVASACLCMGAEFPITPVVPNEFSVA